VKILKHTAVLLCLLLAAALGGCGAAASADDPQAMLARLTVELQQGIVWGEYEAAFDDGIAGAPLRQNGVVCGGLVLTEGYTLQYDAKGMPAGAESLDEAVTLCEFEQLPSPCPCVSACYTGPKGSRWCAFWQPDPTGPLYLMWLDAQQFDRDTLHGLAMSVNIAQ